MPLERVFVDANVLVSASAFTGNESKLLYLAMEQRIKLVIADVVRRETVKVLSEKFPAKLRVFESAMFVLDCEVYSEPPLELMAQARGIVRDPGDVEVLASILACKPDAAVTGDKDLLTDEIRAVAPVCTCAEYLERLTTDNRQPTTDNYYA